MNTEAPPIQSIIARAKAPIMFTAEFEEEKARICAEIDAIPAILSPEVNQDVVAGQIMVMHMLKSIDEAIQPLIDKANAYKDLVWNARNKAKDALLDRRLRLDKQAGDFAALELAKQRSAELAKNKALSQLEQERATERAKAEDHDQLDAIDEKYANRAAEVSQQHAHSPERANGQRITQEWEMTVVDVHALYRAHPNCCKLTPLTGEIKALLDLGVKVQGVKAEKITKATVRATKPKTIDV